MENLATKYRPKQFTDVVYQDSVMQVLVNQIESEDFKQGYLFTGSAGTGKTTTARIFAQEINKNQGKPIEIDGASNNGVDNIRNIIEDCKMKSIDSKYKVYIIDEVHMLSIGAFNALLKVLEEPPKGVIFILCTTDPQKIPATILSRLQRFDFKRIPTDDVVKRLQYIIKKENDEIIQINCGSQDAVADHEWAKKEGINIIEHDIDALYYIAKLANGGMRDAIMKLDTVLGYSNNISIDNVLQCLGISSYQAMRELLVYISRQDHANILLLIEKLFYEGKDLKIFIKDMIQYTLDLLKLELTHDPDLTHIPNDFIEDSLKLAYDLSGNLLEYLNTFNNLNKLLKYEQNILPLVESELILSCNH